MARHGADVDRIFVSGHSAGGHLAALLATDESYLKTHQLSLADIRGVVPISGVFTVRGKVFGDADTAHAASPQTHVRAELPPMLILYGDQERNGLGRQAEEFAGVE